MALRGIDIASYQAGLDVTKIDADFVIVKATQGTGYVNPHCAAWVEAALARGLKVGIYHYIGGGGAVAEMRYFFDQCRNWNGRVMWCLDWESYQNSAWRDEKYLEACIQEIARLTGRPPMVYCSSSYFPWDVCDRNDCGRWVAQYASMDVTGYQDAPWNEGAYTCAIRQYSSTGRVSGWSGNLDLNKFYGNGAAWDSYCGIDTAVDAPTTEENDMISEQAAQLSQIYQQICTPDDPTDRYDGMPTGSHIKFMAATLADLAREVATIKDMVSGLVGEKEEG